MAHYAALNGARHNESFVAVGVEVDDEVAECAKFRLLWVISEQESQLDARN